MMHHIRATSPQEPARTPMLAGWRGLVFVAAGALLRRGRRPFISEIGRLVLMRLLLLTGFVMQVVLILAASYLIDLGISLMELWAELAQKHLELTM